MMKQRLQQWWQARSGPATPRVFTMPEGIRVYAIGDIHGRASLLDRMLDAIAEDAKGFAGDRIIEVFLGDYIDRGMESRQVIDRLLTAPLPGHERVCLMGNHEETLLRFLEEPDILRDWSQHGGFATLASYDVPVPANMSPLTWRGMQAAFRQNFPEKHERFLRHLRLSYELGDYFFVHAGVRPGVPLEAQQVEDCLWIREEFTGYEGHFDQYIVHGHSPLTAPEVLANRANIDVSDASDDRLCCLAVEGAERRTMLVQADGV